MKRSRFVSAAFCTMVLPGMARAADHSPAALSGGSTTVFNDGRDAYSLPLANISRETRRQFAVGNSFFNENWIIAPASAQARDGLGPLFNARSCSACHVKDGRGAPPAGPEEVMTALLVRLSVPGTNERGGPVPHPVYGTQLAVRGIPGVPPEAEFPVSWEESRVTLGDGETVTLRRPVAGAAVWHYGAPGEGLLTSLRLAPPVFGSGLLEAIPEHAIRALADPDDIDHDGISGRVNEVWDHTTGHMAPGRFGWKANQATLLSQTVDAFAGDIGITSSGHPDEDLSDPQRTQFAAMPTGGSPELSDHLLERVVTYLRSLAVPARRGLTDPVALRGEVLFKEARCTACHTPDWQTAADAVLPELRDQAIHPYTDLLLHDMGPGLADGRPDFLATGTEWRTPPLWGLGLNAGVNGHTFYLHDGRARTMEEAILWHDGEAAASREAWKSLPKPDRDALVQFLMAL